MRVKFAELVHKYGTPLEISWSDVANMDAEEIVKHVVTIHHAENPRNADFASRGVSACNVWTYIRFPDVMPVEETGQPWEIEGIKWDMIELINTL